MTQKTWAQFCALGAALALLTGCSATKTAPTTEPTKAAVTTAAAAVSGYCASPTPGEIPAELGGVLTVGENFNGATIRTAQTVSSSKDRSKFDLIVSLCGSEVRGYELKTVASDIARKVKTSPFAKQIADMQVNNMQRPQSDTERSVQADFAINTFAGVAGTSETSWKTRSERGRAGN